VDRLGLGVVSNRNVGWVVVRRLQLIVLNKFRSDQEVLYDYNTDLHDIGNRSLL